MGGFVASHIVGRFAYLFDGDYGTINSNSSIDITGSFRLGYQVKPTSGYVSAIHWNKGDLITPSGTVLLVKSTSGFIDVTLSDGVKFLNYTSNSVIWNYSLPVQLDIVWNNSDKELKIYKDSVLQSITLNAIDANYYSNSSSFTNLNTTNDDLIFGYSDGFDYFYGTFYGDIFNPKVVTQDEIDTYYNVVKVP